MSLENHEEFIEKSLKAATMSPINFPRAVRKRRNLKTIANKFCCDDLSILKFVLAKNGYKISEKGFVTFYIDKNWKKCFDINGDIIPIVSKIDCKAFQRPRSKGFWQGIENEGFTFDKNGNAIRESIPNA